MMDDDVGVNSLIQLIFVKQTINESELRARFPPCLLTRDFSQSMKDVLTVKQIILVYRWRKYFDTCSCKMLSSHEMYLQCIMYACLKEHECNQSIFDSLISACVLVRSLSSETLQKTGVNYWNLNPLIVMSFYKNVLKGIFCRRGGFQRLVEYIHNHRYRKWKRQNKFLIVPDDSIASVDDFLRALAEKLQKEFKKERIFEKVIDLDEIVKDETSRFMARITLQTIDIQLPILPSYQDLVQTLVAYRRKEMSQIAEKKISVAAVKFESLEQALQVCSCSNSDSEASYAPRHKNSEVKYENIIQAVIKYNHSKSSAEENVNNRIQEEAGRVLENLKRNIKSLNEVLDGYDE